MWPIPCYLITALPQHLRDSQNILICLETNFLSRKALHLSKALNYSLPAQRHWKTYLLPSQEFTTYCNFRLWHGQRKWGLCSAGRK